MKNIILFTLGYIEQFNNNIIFYNNNYNISIKFYNNNLNKLLILQYYLTYIINYFNNINKNKIGNIQKKKIIIIFIIFIH